MDYTRFGEELKALRTRRHQSIQDMADVLGVSKGFLSRVESGKKAIPGDWIDILCDHYHLKPYPRQILEEAAALSKTRIQINVSKTRVNETGTSRPSGRSFFLCYNQEDEEVA